MGRLVLAGFAALALGSCASTEAVQRQAALNCQAVGITERDPQFSTCTQAFRRTYLEDRLDQTYHDAANPTPTDRRIPHDWVY
jgi:hypothetical protein